METIIKALSLELNQKEEYIQRLEEIFADHIMLAEKESCTMKK